MSGESSASGDSIPAVSPSLSGVWVAVRRTEVPLLRISIRVKYHVSVVMVVLLFIDRKFLVPVNSLLLESVHSGGTLAQLNVMRCFNLDVAHESLILCKSIANFS